MRDLIPPWDRLASLSVQARSQAASGCWSLASTAPTPTATTHQQGVMKRTRRLHNMAPQCSEASGKREEPAWPCAAAVASSPCRHAAWPSSPVVLAAILPLPLLP